jgi:hypothetical protein
VVGDGEAEADVIAARRFSANRGQNLARAKHLLFVTDPHRPMVNGPGVRIWAECVALADEIVTAGQDQAARADSPSTRLLG